METHTVMLFENKVLGIIPAPLLMLGVPLYMPFVRSLKYVDIGVREYCWSPPTFCNGLFNPLEKLRSFSIAVSCYRWVQYLCPALHTGCEKVLVCSSLNETNFSTFDAYTDRERKARVTSD